MKYRKLTTIKADGTVNVEFFENKVPLTVLQERVEGYIEMIPFFKHYEGRPVKQVFGNEEAKLKNLPLNRRATLLWYDSMTKQGRGLDDRIHGTIVIDQPATNEEVARLK